MKFKAYFCIGVWVSNWRYFVYTNMLDCIRNSNRDETFHDGEDWIHQQVTIHSQISNYSLEANTLNQRIKMSTTLHASAWKKITNIRSNKYLLGVVQKDKLWYISQGIRRLKLTSNSFEALLFETVLDKFSAQTVLSCSGSSNRAMQQQMYVQMKKTFLRLVISPAKASGFNMRLVWAEFIIIVCDPTKRRHQETPREDVNGMIQ